MASDTENIFLPHQFSNRANTRAHTEGTGREIRDRLEKLNIVADAFVAGVGTGGTVMGVGAFLRKKNPRVKIHPLEPSESPTLSTGCKVGQHRIQGVSDEFTPAIVELDKLDEVISVSDGDSILMAQKLARTLGLAVGISSGANFLGALTAQNSAAMWLWQPFSPTATRNIFQLIWWKTRLFEKVIFRPTSNCFISIQSVVCKSSFDLSRFKFINGV